MRDSDFVKLEYMLRHARTGAQKRAVIDRFPDLAGMGVQRVRGVLNVATSVRTGVSLKAVKARAKRRFLKHVKGFIEL